MNTTKQNNQGYQALIMVIDDNPEFLSGITLTLEMEGFKVWTATDGQHALDELQSALQQGQTGTGMERLPDLILADIMMPVMDGYEFYERVQANPYMNHIPFIFLTAKSSDEDIRYGKELGSDDYLPKLYPPEDILASIRGKLKRVKQRRTLMARLTGDSDQPLKGGLVIAIAVVGALILIAFCLGALLPLPWG